MAAAIYEQIEGAEPYAGAPGFYQFPCSSAMNIGFQFGGQNYMINKEDLIFGSEGPICVGTISVFHIADDSDTQFAFLMGEEFMKNVVTVFDLGTPAVGFGRLRDTGKQYGEYTVVPLDQMTAMGTGPSAALLPTFNPLANTTIGILKSLIPC
jgi:cathepsin D